MLLANGYIRVDMAAASGPGYDPTAAQYITQYGAGLFERTDAEYKNPTLYGNANGSPSPEQLVLPGSRATPALGLCLVGVVTGVAIVPAVVATGVALAPAVAQAAISIVEACAANAVLCGNEFAITLGEVAAGGAMPAGTGAAVAAGAAGAGKAAAAAADDTKDIPSTLAGLT